MGDVEDVRKDVGFQAAQDFGGGHRLRGRRRKKRGPQIGGIAFGTDRFIAQAREMVGEQIDDAISQLAHFGGGQFEVCVHWILIIYGWGFRERGTRSLTLAAQLDSQPWRPMSGTKRQPEANRLDIVPFCLRTTRKSCWSRVPTGITRIPGSAS